MEEEDGDADDPDNFQAYGVCNMVSAHQCCVMAHLAFNVFRSGSKSLQVMSKTTGDAAVFKGLATFGCNKVSACY